MLRPLPLSLLLLALPALAVTGAPATAATLRMSTTAFGQPLAIEAAGSADPEPAMRDAIAAVRAMEALTDVSRGPLAELNAQAGAGPQVVPPELLAILRRALEFCAWSEGTWGPLGGRLNELWGLRQSSPVLPRPDVVRHATAAAACNGLRVDGEARTATLAAGAQLDLWGFARGAGVDAALDRLVAAGVTNTSVTLGPVQRAAGAGPHGTGWPLRVEVPAEIAGLTRRLDLRDRAFAIAAAGLDAMWAGGVPVAPWLDHRSGEPGEGVVAAAVVTERALDAEGLAATGFITGNRRGANLMSQLRPAPAALWLLGQGTGTPLLTDYRWGSLPRRPTAR